MRRHEFSDEQWKAIEPHLPGKAGDSGRTGQDNMRRAQKGARLPRIGTLPWGFSTKIHVAVDGEGQPVKLHLTEGERHDVTCAEILFEGLESEHVIAEQGIRQRSRCAKKISLPQERQAGHPIASQLPHSPLRPPKVQAPQCGRTIHQPT